MILSSGLDADIGFELIFKGFYLDQSDNDLLPRCHSAALKGKIPKCPKVHRCHTLEHENETRKSFTHSLYWIIKKKQNTANCCRKLLEFYAGRKII